MDRDASLIEMLVRSAAAAAMISCAPVASAQNLLSFAGGPESTRWALSGTVFNCRFEQEVPGYGKAVFTQRAGEDLRFQLEPDRPVMARTQARVSIAPPPWQPSTRSQPLGVAQVSDTSPNIILDSGRANQFLHALREGKMPTLSHEVYYDDDRYVQVQVSAVQFEPAYQDYLLCADQLLKVNLDQIGRTRVLFGSGEDAIDSRDAKALDRIIYYIKNDPRVTEVYLDGHADNLGRRYDNRQISRRRVESVERYFLQEGIAPELITTRFHGGRYPVGSNATAAGRAQNRRVTVRLVIDEDMPLPDNLVFRLPEDSHVLPSLSFPITTR